MAFVNILGHYEHEYKGLRHPDGVRFVRSHNSTTDVHRMHTKVPYFPYVFIKSTNYECKNVATVLRQENVLQ